MTKTFLKYRTRVTIVSSTILFSWVLLSARLFQVMILDGDGYRLKGIEQARTKEILPAVRGNIYDRKNRPLTRNIIQIDLAANPQKIQDHAAFVETISTVMERPKEFYEKKLQSTAGFVYLERNLKRQEFQPLLETRLPGMIVKRKGRRYYPHLNVASQVVGFTDVDDRGLAGIEKEFDEFLTGINGWAIKEKSGEGRINPKNSYPVNPPVDGNNIQLTIDLFYQAILQEELQTQLDKTKAVSASGLLMNPQNGAILAMTSIPDFDPNYPGRSPQENQKNKAVTDQFEPGSTFKIVPAAAALENNSVDITEEFNCENGKFVYAGRTIRDWEDFGLLTFSQIMEQSSNVGIIKIADRLGPNNLHRYSRNFGFGSSTNIKLPGESTGTLYPVKDWSAISLAELSLGHEVGVTALQLGIAYSAIANGGFLVKPRLVEQIISSAPKTEGKVIYSERPEVIRKVIPETVAKTLTEILVRAVDRGTGQNAHIPGWSVAGKTGTAQKFIDGEYSESKFISNFVGFFPANDPQILGVVVLDEPVYGLHWGGYGAAPVFRRVAERIINMNDSLQPPAKPQMQEPPRVLAEDNRIPAREKSTAPIVLATFASTSGENLQGFAIIPDVRGMSLKKAKQVLKNSGLKSKSRGSGQVVWQSPRPGTKAGFGSICTIGLK